MTVGAGRGLAAERTLIVGTVIWVSERAGLLPRNSVIVPVTWTASPTETVGAELVNTKTPSDVAVFASGVGSWIQNPFVDLAVTMPVVVCEVPRSGDVC